MPIKFFCKRCLITKRYIKKQFYSKQKATNKVISGLTNREDLVKVLIELWGREHTAKFRKVLKKELARRNNFKIVNMGADSNVVCTLVASSSDTGEENATRQVSVS